VVTALTGGTALGEELRRAVVPGGWVHGEWFARTILAAAAFAAHRGCSPQEVRQVAGEFVRASLAHGRGPEVADACARHAASIVDAVCLVLGSRGLVAEFATVRVAIPGLLDPQGGRHAGDSGR
jgi:hypothetical protein